MNQEFIISSNKRKFLFLIAAGFLLAFIFFAPRAYATTFTWDGDGGDSNLSTAGNWAGGTAPTGVSGDALVFTGSTGLTPNNDIVGGTFTSITFSATGFTLSGNALTLDGGAAAISNTVGTNIISANITFGTAAPTISITTSTTFTISGTIDNGGLLVTVDVGSSAANTLSGVISGTGGLTKTSSGTTTISGANTFSGGFTLKQGDFVAGVSNSGSTSGAAGPSTSAITLGASDGGSANLYTGCNFTISNAINLASGAVGTLVIGSVSASTCGSSNFSGAIALGGNNLTIYRASINGTSGGMVISGGITGTGNVTFQSDSGSVSTISTASVNNVGTFTNISSGAGTVTISGGVGANVTGITLNSTVSALTISTTALTVNSTATTLTNSSGTVLLTVTSAIDGTGNLILNNNSSTAAGITLSSTAVNHTGTITNSGSGSGGVTISKVIGTNVTGLTQNSSTSALTASGANTFTGGTTVQCGTFTPGVSNATTVSGAAGPSTVTIALGSSSGCAATIAPSSAWTISNPITIGSGAIGTTTITSQVTSAPTYSGAIALNGNDLYINDQNAVSGAMTISGGITGTGNLILNNAGLSGASLTFTTNSVNNTGTITSFAASLAPISITGGVGANVTQIKSTGGAFTISTTALTVNSAGTTLIHNGSSPSQVFTVTGGTTGTGNLILQNTKTVTGITLSTTAVNHTGTITNSSISTGGVSITAVIGTTVTGVTQNSSTSALSLSGANTFTGGLTIKKGIVNANVSNVDTTSGAAGPSSSTITLGASDGGAATLRTTTTAITVSNPITLGTGAVGILKIENGGTTITSIFTGAIALNGNNLTLSVAGTSGSLTVSGDITGTGDVTVRNAGTSGSTMALSGSSINNVGTVSVSNTSTGAITIGATVGSNVTTFAHSATSTTGLGALVLNASNTFGTFRDDDALAAHSIQFGAGTTQTVTTWDVSGASGALVTLQSSAGGSPWTVTSATAGNQVSDYISISDSIGAGTSVWVAGSHSTNGGSNSGWSFSGIPSVLSFSTGPVYTNYGETMPAIIVHVLDASDNLVTTAVHSITLAIGNNPNNGTLSGTLTKTASQGIATFSDLSIDKSGRAYTLSASASGLTGVTSGSFDITNPPQSGGGGGGGGSSYSPPAAVLPTVPAVSSAQSTLDALIKRLQELQAQIAEQKPGADSTPIIPHAGAPGIVISQVSRPLTTGGRGDDVQSLQNFLISSNVGIAAQQLQSVGSTAYFGSITRAALAEFQKSVGISPAVGYFGPITKAYLKKMGY